MQLCNIFIKNKAAVIQSSIHPLSTLATLQQRKHRTRYVHGVFQVSIINGGEKSTGENTGHNTCAVFAYCRVSVIHCEHWRKALNRIRTRWCSVLRVSIIQCALEKSTEEKHWRKAQKKITERTQCIPSIYYPVCTNNDERRCQGESTHLSEKGQIQSGHCDEQNIFFVNVLMPEYY